MVRKLAVATLTVVVICCLVGCPKRSVTIRGPEGEKTTVTPGKEGGNMTITGSEGEKTTVKTDEGEKKTTVTVQGKEGESKIEISETVDLSKLGVEAYPGATTEGGGTYKAEGEEQGQIAGANLKTPDPFDKVAKFYKDKYAKGATLVSDQPNNLLITRQEKGKMVTIAVSREKDAKETKIAISVIEGMGQ